MRSYLPYALQLRYPELRKDNPLFYVYDEESDEDLLKKLQ